MRNKENPAVLSRNCIQAIFHCGNAIFLCVNYDKFKDCVLTFCLHRYQQMMQTLKNSMSLVVESLISKCEEDQRKKEGLVHDRQCIQSSRQYNCNDNCSDSDSSFNQVKFALIMQTTHL